MNKRKNFCSLRRGVQEKTWSHLCFRSRVGIVWKNSRVTFWPECDVLKCFSLPPRPHSEVKIPSPPLFEPSKFNMNPSRVKDRYTVPGLPSKGKLSFSFENTGWKGISNLLLSFVCKYFYFFFSRVYSEFCRHFAHGFVFQINNELMILNSDF